MKRSREKPDCRKCGACCISYYDQTSYVDVTEYDLKRLGASYVRRNVEVDDFTGRIRTRHKKMKAGPLEGCVLCVCTSLRGSVFNKTSCAIYLKRPTACRQALKPGDKACRYIREWLRSFC